MLDRYVDLVCTFLCLSLQGSNIEDLLDPESRILCRLMGAGETALLVDGALICCVCIGCMLAGPWQPGSHRSTRGDVDTRRPDTRMFCRRRDVMASESN